MPNLGLSPESRFSTDSRMGVGTSESEKHESHKLDLLWKTVVIDVFLLTCVCPQTILSGMSSVISHLNPGINLNPYQGLTTSILNIY